MNKKKFIAVIVASSMALSCAACSKTGEKKDDKKAKKDIIKCAENFTDALFDFDDGLVDYTNLKSSDADEISESFAFVNEYIDYDPDMSQAFGAIMDTFSYEIDEDTLEIDDDEAEVEVTYTHVDMEFVIIDGWYDTVDDLCDAIENADTEDYTIKYKFELNDDDEWVITNAMKIFEEFGDCIEVNNLMSSVATPVTETDLAAAWDGYSWYASDNGTYTDTLYINFYGGFNYSLINDYNDIQIYFVVERDGSVIYTSEIMDDADFYYTAAMDADCVDGYLPSGTYTVTCYDANDNVIDSGSCTVINTASATPVAPSTPDAIEGTQYLADFDMALFFESNLPDCTFTGSAPINMYLILSDDGNYAMGFDCTTDELIEIMGDYIRLNIETITVDGMGYTRDQIEPMLPQDGIETWEQFLDLMADNMIQGMEASATEMGGTGTYVISGSDFSFVNGSGETRHGTVNADGSITLPHEDGFELLFIPQ